MSGPAALTFDSVSFGYRRGTPVLRDLSWSPGRTTALLGPNGAGKSTVFGIGSGARKPVSGQVLLDGRRPPRGSVGWMPQDVQAQPGLRCREQVALAGWMHGMSRTVAWSAASAALAQVDLADRAADASRNLSGGQRRRLGIAEILVSQPKVVFLDEPTVGLDPSQRERILRLITDLGEQYQVIVSTHLVADLSETFDRVTVLARGSIRFDGPVAEFLALTPPGTGPDPATAAYRAIVGDAT